MLDVWGHLERVFGLWQKLEVGDGEIVERDQNFTGKH
jgi:hypothetical protein